jgi:arsenate reductase
VMEERHGGMCSSRRFKVLFLCSGNSCRSQMAEGFARERHGAKIEAFSAGAEARGLDTRAVRVMAEAGVDIGGQKSKTLADLSALTFDLVVTLCGAARESCPAFTDKTKVVHAGFDNPPELARGAGSEEEALAHYRRVRDEIAAFVDRLPEVLENG